MMLLSNYTALFDRMVTEPVTDLLTGGRAEGWTDGRTHGRIDGMTTLLIGLQIRI